MFSNWLLMRMASSVVLICSRREVSSIAPATTLQVSVSQVPSRYELQIVCPGLQRLAGSPVGAEKVGTKDTSAARVIRLKGVPRGRGWRASGDCGMSRLASTLAGTDA